MSALFGIIRFGGGPVRKDELELMAGALSCHRTDGVSTWIGKSVGLGRILRVITPEDQFDQQPVLSENSESRLLFCGRIDNRTELLNQLGPFETAWSEVSDSVIASEAFQRWGLECADRIVGDYVFVAWQAREQRVYVVRGPFSERTLFYFLCGDILVFATSPLGLFALPFVHRELNRERLADYVVRAPIEPDQSFFQSIRTVEGGSITTIDREGSKMRSFWQASSLPEIRFRTDGEYEEAFLERFDQAVKARLRSAFPLAAMMSGGIDSSSVACTAALLLAERGERLDTFTQVPRVPSDELAGEYYTDERPFVQAIARKYGNINMHLVHTEEECVLSGHAAFIAAGGAPFRNVGNRPWMEEILRRAQSLGARAVLTGALGNFAFSWSGNGVLPGMLQRGQFGKAWRHAAALSSESTLRRFLGHGVLPLLPSPVWLAVKRRVDPDNLLLTSSPPWSAISPLRREFEQMQRVRQRARDRGHDLLGRPNRSSLATRMSLFKSIESASPEIICGLEARHGVELRDPTVDRRVVEFCLSIPEEQFQLNGVSRSLPRRAMAKRWPPEVAANTRRGLQASDWRPVLLKTLPELRDTFDRISSSPLAVEILDLDRIRKVLDAVDPASDDSHQTYVDVHHILYFGLGLGQFFEWIECPANRG